MESKANERYSTAGKHGHSSVIFRYIFNLFSNTVIWSLQMIPFYAIPKDEGCAKNITAQLHLYLNLLHIKFLCFKFFASIQYTVKINSSHTKVLL